MLVIAVTCGFGLIVGTADSTAGRISAFAAATAFAAGYAAALTALARRSSAALVILDRGPEVEIPGSRAVALLLLLAFLALTAFPIFFAIGVFRDGLSPGSEGRFAMSMLVGLFCLPVVVMLALGRFRMNRLILNPDSVIYKEYRGETSLPWADISSVTITSDPKAQIVLSGPQGQLPIPIGAMASGPVPLAEYLDDLVRHPARRPTAP